MMKHNIEISHTDFNTANVKTIDNNFSYNKRKSKCLGFNQSET